MSIQSPKVVVVTGSKKAMGRTYGRTLEQNLKAVYEIVVGYYVNEKNIPMEKVVAKANLFFDKYPYGYQMFLEGVAEGANITLEQAKILNAMETLNSLVRSNSEVAACAFISIPPDKSASNSVIIGRNYDFLPPFDRCSEYLTITVIKETDHVPTAFIGFAGQVYCPTCVNQNGLFVELNNGMPSGGFYTDHSRESLLINLLEAIQNSATMNQLDRQLSALNSDYSLVINTANSTHVKSYEYSSTHGMKASDFKGNEVLVSTNYFTHQEWTFELPSDEGCWLGHTRRSNLLQLSNNSKNMTTMDVQGMLDTNIGNGGATWEHTLYQLIFDTSSLTLMVKMPKVSDTWHNVSLASHFGSHEVEMAVCTGQTCDLES